MKIPEGQREGSSCAWLRLEVPAVRLFSSVILNDYNRSYLAVTALQIQHNLVSTLLGIHTLKLKTKIPNSELSA